MQLELELDLRLKEKEKADKKAKAEAHVKLDKLHKIFDLYNNKKLENDTKLKSLLRILQKEAQEARALVLFLYQKNNCPATRAYMVFVARMLIRLSHLIHDGRVETLEERVAHIQAVREKYGMNELTESEMMLNVEILL